MNEASLHQWLFENGGASIRYRTTKELLTDTAKVEVEKLRADLLASKMTQQWLNHVGKPGQGLASFHHSRPEAFENAASKLCDLGLQAGLSVLDEKMQPFHRWLNTQVQAIREIAAVDYEDVTTKKETQSAVERGLNWFEAMLVAARLAWMGYDTPAIRTCLAHRLDTLYTLAKTGNYDIYIDQDTFGDYPNNAFRKKPLVAPQFNSILPNIHDIYALAHYPQAAMRQDVQQKMATVVAYILHPDYQNLHAGYGVMRAGPRRYFSIGWSVHLPGYHGLEFDNGQAKMFVQRLALMAHFPTARQHPWFQNCVTHLESFRTDEGLYRFPARYLKESSSGYWVTGAYMRLEENRRARQSLNLDSTFRMLKIKSCYDRRSHADTD